MQNSDLGYAGKRYQALTGLGERLCAGRGQLFVDFKLKTATLKATN